MGRVGPKGQVVISKEIRDRLGIGPGWLALQRLVDDHVELFFVPPSDKSLGGVLAPFLHGMTIPEEEWQESRERAWEVAANERFGSEPPAE